MARYNEEDVQEKSPKGTAGSDDTYAERPDTTRRLLWKLDLHLLPMVSILYLLSFLDRSNVANARIEGLVTDVKMTGSSVS